MIIGYFDMVDGPEQVEEFRHRFGGAYILTMDGSTLIAFPSSYTMEGMDEDWAAMCSATRATFDTVRSPQSWLRESLDSVSARFEDLTKDPRFH
jgi:hypothetical protein